MENSCALLAALLAVMVVSSAMLAEVSQGLCNMTQEGLVACKPACRTGAKQTAKPSDACCAALSRADMPCLCTYKSSPLLPFVGIDPKLAMHLPAKCNVTTAEQC